MTVKGSKVPLVLYGYNDRSLDTAPAFENFTLGPEALPPVREALTLLVKPGIAEEKKLGLFSEACDAYLSGEGAVAYGMLQLWHAAFPNDKPANVLIDYMGANHSGGQGMPVAPPTDWQGFRALTEK